jgi:hypothetical protein
VARASPSEAFAASGTPRARLNACTRRPACCNGLAGIPVQAGLVRELADRVGEPTATTLRQALEREQAVIALTIDEREQILRALEDCPPPLAELRGFLVCEHEWRVEQGLV